MYSSFFGVKSYIKIGLYRFFFCFFEDGQRVLKHDLDTKTTSNIQFSNCEVLGLPYWFVCNLERVSTW